MKYKFLPQEILKLIACITMLLDHIGATIFPSTALRIIGRIAFPIYCFLLAEGMRRTRNPGKYLLRLGIGVLLSELPFDYLFSGGLDWGYQSVMVTLFLGGLMLLCMNAIGNRLLKLLPVIPFYLLAELAQCDYGGTGILIITLFGLTDNLLIHLPWLTLINYFANSYQISILGQYIPIQLFAVASLLPIGLYSGKKLTRSRIVQWGFYLFYPVHLTVLLLIWMLRV